MSQYFSFPQADVQSVELVDPIDAAVAGLPLYPDANMVKARQVRLTMKDGRVYRQIEVVIVTPDSQDMVDTWFGQQGRKTYRGPDTAASARDTQDYRIWLDTRNDRTRVTMLRYFRD